MSYDHRSVEARWQAHWAEHETFKAEVDRSKPKYYVLDMFPYPSGDGLHVGHPEGYTATDIVARYKRQKGFNVLHPMGWDAFGLPAERYAIKTGTHPAVRTKECIDNFRRQLSLLGFSYDWSREIATTDPAYYRWTQWIFLQVWGAWFDAEQNRARPIEELPIPAEVRGRGASAVRRYRDEHRLAYQTEAPVNWNVEERVVLANEEVAEATEKGFTVIRKPMRQWMMRITEYAERLLDGLEGLDWPSSVIRMQREWIGRSEGAEVDFRVLGLEGGESGETLTVFTTRPDTLWGATYMVLAPEHPLVQQVTDDEHRSEVEAYVASAATKSDRDRQIEGAKGDKTGVFTGGHAINPVNGAPTPIWISDYVLMGYGTGAIMAVPGHDERDHAFARAMNLPIVQVVDVGESVDIEAEARPGDGHAMNSGFLNGETTENAKRVVTEWLEEEGSGRGKVTYKLRDWLFSRQRYWGEPFPLLLGEDGEVRAAEHLPVELPDVEDFSPSETGEPALAKAADWVEADEHWRRETNTMPQWAGSCWYYLRFCDPQNDGLPWDSEVERYWMPVDLYVGGAEHAVLHLLYARFWHKVLHDLGHVSTNEPFHKLVNQGMVLGASYVPAAAGDKRKFVQSEVEELQDGSFVHAETREPLKLKWDKMSKSKGNVVNPDEVIDTYGADTMRLYEMFMGPLEASAPWQPEGVAGVYRFLTRAYSLFFEDDAPRSLPEGPGTEIQRRLLHRTIADVTERIERMAFNTAISALMVFARDIQKSGNPLTKDEGCQFCLLLSPFAPHLAEEIWQRALGHGKTLAFEPWPEADEALLVEDTWNLVVQINGKKRDVLELPASVEAADRSEIQARALASETIQRHLEGKEPRKVIVVPGKLVNIVL